MCDLWKNALPSGIPPGVVPRQIDYALAQLGFSAETHCANSFSPVGGKGQGKVTPRLPEQVKLYNSGSFFDLAAIPAADYPAIARRVAFAPHVIVESHPRLVGDRTLAFRDSCNGTLEVAIGLETVHPEILPKLNKKSGLLHFERAASFLRRENIGVRAFVLVKTPWMNDAEAVEWAVKSAQFAFGCGADVVSLIPTRPGNGALDRLVESGEFTPPQLATLEHAQEEALKTEAGRVFADTWNLEPFSTCPACLELRRQRMHAMNLRQELLPRIHCAAC